MALAQNMNIVQNFKKKYFAAACSALGHQNLLTGSIIYLNIHIIFFTFF
jgi:hypothetical protein